MPRFFLANFFKAVHVHEHVQVNVHDYVYDFPRLVRDCAELKGCLYVVVLVDLRRGR
jgi:hypothetical protein